MTECPFCDISRYSLVNGTVAAFRDGFPVSPGHTLVVPLRHVEDFFGLSVDELIDTFDLIDTLSAVLRAGDPTVAGFNIGVNCGEAAGQTVMHSHVHLIPRRVGDTPEPRGGVRGVIPGKMRY